jgi:DNA-3-methyladenine glycosylase II
VSTKAADAIWHRFKESLGQPTPEKLLSISDHTMREIGLSRQKVLYIRGLAQASLDGAIDYQELSHLDNVAIENKITSLKGFGKWSAQMYLMFGLARTDIFPAADLGIREGIKKYAGLDYRPGEEEAFSRAVHFAPHFTAASLLLWHLNR